MSVNVNLIGIMSWVAFSIDEYSKYFLKVYYTLHVYLTQICNPVMFMHGRGAS